MSQIKKIVLTGGPCAGKTTALVRTIEHFTSLGFKVFTIPEVPTMFSQAGVDYTTPNRDFFYEEEKATLQTQLELEDHFARMAEASGMPAIIVCDRGTMDISAYMEPALWDRLTKDVGTTTPELRDKRYDAVLHLVSAADGAEQFYTTANNKERRETADEEGLRMARELDKRVIAAWTGHPHLRVINNHENFEAKIHRVLKEISNVLGLAQPITEERKYVVEITGPVPDAIESDIVQTYLSSDPNTVATAPAHVGRKVRLRAHHEDACLRTRASGDRAPDHVERLSFAPAAGRPLPPHDTQAPHELHLERPILRSRLVSGAHQQPGDSRDQRRRGHGTGAFSAVYQSGEGHHRQHQLL